MAIGKRLMNWLSSDERRRGVRREPIPPLLAFYWDGSTPVPHVVHDASPTGFYLLTEHRWYPGTVLALTLQRSGAHEDEADRSISVSARVVRVGPDGVGFEFVLAGDKNSGRTPADAFPMPPVDSKRLNAFLDRVRAGARKSYETATSA